MNNEHDYYTILGVERNADTDTIKKAYRRLAMKPHDVREITLQAGHYAQHGKHYSNSKIGKPKSYFRMGSIRGFIQ